MAFTRYRTQAFALKERDRGEADKIFTVFSKEFGKISILGKSIRMAKSKLRGNMSIFSLLDLEFIQGKSLKTLVDAELLENYQNIKQNPNVLLTLSNIVDVFDKLVYGTEKELRLWFLFKEVFDVLNNIDIDFAGFYVCHWFYWRLFAILGYCPELYHCLSCNKKLQISGSYFASRGGIICSDCLSAEKGAIAMSTEAIKMSREIFQRSLDDFLKIKIKKNLQKSLEKNLERIFIFHLSHIY